MTWSCLPAPRRRKIDENVRTDVFVTLSRLMTEWRDDPDCLAVVCAAYALGGWASCWIVDEVASGYPHPSGYIRTEQARELVDRALRRRNHKLLRARAEGLLMALEATAKAFEAQRLHEVQVDAAVIECRLLDIDERIARLRQMEAVPDV